LVGQWHGFEEGRNLHGRIDELAIFARELKLTEIRNIFEAGNPADVGKTAIQADKK
jgi:hypothetical protein